MLFILVGTAGLDLPAMRSWELLFEVYRWRPSAEIDAL